jgi:GH24 family phage-related lysozyme (muramidase)
VAARARIAIAGLTISAAAFVATVGDEGYTDNAVIPVAGDVPTYGFGMTHHPDGSKVKLGEKTTPQKALRESLAHLQASEGKVKDCVTADVYQMEFDTLVKFSYQFGDAATCGSAMVVDTNLGNYWRACQDYLQYRFIHKGKPNEYDCSTFVDGKPNKVCYGVWTRQLERYKDCMSVQ